MVRHLDQNTRLLKSFVLAFTDHANAIVASKMPRRNRLRNRISETSQTGCDLGSLLGCVDLSEELSARPSQRYCADKADAADAADTADKLSNSSACSVFGSLKRMSAVSAASAASAASAVCCATTTFGCAIPTHGRVAAGGV